MNEEFINQMSDFIKESINNKDQNKVKLFYKAITFWFFNNPYMEYYNVLSILSSNINASYCCTLAKWRVKAKQINPNHKSIVIPMAGSKAYTTYIPHIKNNQFQWRMVKVFDYSQIANFPKGFSIESRIQKSEELGNEIISIDEYIKEIEGIDTFFDDYLNVYENQLKKYSPERKKYIIDIIIYGLIQSRVYENEEQINFDTNIIEDNYLDFMHDVYLVLNGFPKYLYEKIEEFKKEVITSQKNEKILQRADRNIKERIDDVKERMMVI